MKTTHSFVAPVLNSTQSKVNTEAYEQAIDNYNAVSYTHLTLPTSDLV